MDTARLLVELAAEVRVCPLCRLAETRTNAVPGEGNPRASLMFVGEGPGENEDRQGRPFIGAAGQFLNELLAAAGIAREDVFITNIVKCRPPGNRDPLPDEVEACNDYLMAQIALVDPKFVVTLGAPSMRTLIDAKLKITAARCRVFRKNGIFFVPLFHPAAALHNPKLLQTLQSDILTLKELITRPLREDEITVLEPAFTPGRTPHATLKDIPEPAEMPEGPLTLF